MSLEPLTELEPKIHKIEQELFAHLRATNYSIGPLVLYTSYLQKEAWKSGFIAAIILVIAVAIVLWLVKSFGII